MSELSKRILVSLVFIPVLIAALYFEGIPLFLMFLVVSIVGTQEFIFMMRKADISLAWFWHFVNPILFTFWVFFPQADLSLLWISLLISLLHALIHWDVKRSVAQVFASIFACIYTALIPAMIVRIAWYHSETKILLALILMIWIVDSVAYFIGMRFGKKREITKVSPKKSLEGFVAGLLAPALISFILCISGFDYFSPVQYVLLAVAAGVFGQLGDLLESMLKRFCNVKDSSKLIPGHGGILDRTDSILFAGSFLYVALVIF
ncbi:MAG: phosphatidate cytidylyltransferase [Candidatus Cloacimonetes bacterium]|jgi:phosphatidate cytidylyltransferase|nr:phosphatidate cytidylyltransferase [Candidatus Cloacimonadota bacterium]MDY0299717.1 phosphatidate cytidylyltransferase [Candidatus Cloacimonadaceae bacterium]MCK9333516.1 phosphatidate cytidylyltransferase [Candidatus Cloacimonadota bacterium]MDD2211150.1 phosphatidate cytidylyltransferase [Candidatus Cloacimonadota bacterium]MDD3283002.1 phosphatidate cytidylyltransferase [Candidatus Cloacimonadota bacterium]